MGAGFGFLLLPLASNELPPLVQSVAKFSQASGATSQNSLKTIRLPWDGNSVTTVSRLAGILLLHSLITVMNNMLFLKNMLSSTAHDMIFSSRVI